jgi:hypothetical protein
MKDTLDFICIGAAKAGTTTLFELLKSHPDLLMPSEKEVPFFSNDTAYSKGLAWYMQTYFSKPTQSDTLCGTITPQYMLGENGITPDEIAERIHQSSPAVKLIVILRHPIERAYSHYKMSAQRGHLSDTFEASVDKLLDEPAMLEQARQGSLSIENNFLLGSEYGHELSSFYDRFDNDRILVLFTDDLKRDPQSVIDRVTDFLGVRNFIPEGIGGEFRKGGGKAKIPFLKPGIIYKIPFVKRIWQNHTPYAFRKRIEYSINLWNIKPDNERLDTASPTYDKLVRFYSKDITLLETLIGQTTPWTDWTNKQRN